MPPSLARDLESLGVRAIHASEEDLVRADAKTLLECAIEDECLLVTRNYGDFTDLAVAFNHAGRDFPGVLFIPQGADGPEQAARIARWIDDGGAEAARNGCRWL